MSNPSPRLVVFTDFHPLGQHVGGVCTRALLRDYPADRVFWVGLRSRFDKDWPDEPYPLLTLNRPRQWRGETLAKPMRDLFSTLWQVYLATVLAPRYASQIVSYARTHRAEALFVILNADPTMTYVTHHIQRQAPDLPVKVLVHDPPTRMCPELVPGLAAGLRLLIHKRLRQVVRRCDSLAVCSEGMGAVYRRDFGRDSEVLIHGLPKHLFLTPRPGFATGDKLILGFAGSAYPANLWKVLFTDLDRLGWQIDQRAVEIHFLGHPPAWLERRPQVKMLGWQTQEKTLEVLSRCDLCYLPYWFDPVHAESAEQCFPTKLPTYVAAGRPVLYHGPQESSPTVFFRQFQAALCCHDTVPGHLAELLQQLVRTPGLLESLASESQRAAREYLREDLFRKGFARLIQA